MKTIKINIYNQPYKTVAIRIEQNLYNWFIEFSDRFDQLAGK